jgi:formate hydrogenlyase subunit 3/multisubunit Na+/H+ antiporter MnhD subunit
MISYSGLIADVVTARAFLLVLSIVVPVAGALLAFATGGRRGERIALGTMPLGLAIAVSITFAMRQTGAPLVYLLGGWAPPLGVALRADGLSVVMMAITALVICAIGVYARADFRIPAGSVEARAPFAFWILLLAIWGALNTVFLASDLFTLYVALELLTFAAVPLVCLDGRGETLQAALRYLLFALLGSALYLVGTALLYGAYGTLDIVLLSHRVTIGAATLVAAALMTVGLLAKTALFPLHLWLPPAHAGAPAPASAVLSALVVKGSFFIIVRLWFDVMPRLPGPKAAQLIAGLGAAAILFGSVLALRQERLKLLIAYSTLAQIGYLFLMFPLAFDPGSAQLQSGGALTAGILQAISHATAKGAMFMAAGLIYAALGHDRITGLAGVARALPMSVLAFALGGLALVGVPPSGASLAKELFLQAAAETQQWWWAVVIQTGGIFTSGYLLLVLAQAVAPADRPIVPRVRIRRIQEAAALGLALCSLLLGLAPWDMYLSVPVSTSSNPLALKALAKALWPILGGAILAILLGRWGHWPAPASFGDILVATVGPARRAALTFARMIELVDGVLRQWSAATFSLLVVAIIFGVAMLAGR